MTSRRWPRLLAAVGVLTAVALSGCTSSAPHRKLGKCEAPCTGAIGGAKYMIKVPKNWNGTLLIFSHGYQFAGTELHSWLSPHDQSATGNDPLSLALLDKGFALAGSGWSATGWAVRDGVDAANQLYDKFVHTVRKPTRAYAWGVSLGGLVTEQLAETSKWVDGAAPMCGVVAGPLANFDNWLEAEVGAQTLFGASYPLSGQLTVDQAKQRSRAVNAALDAARTDTQGGGAAKLLYLADLLGLPDKSMASFDDSRAGRLGAAQQNLAGYLYSGALFLAEARERFGGNPAKVYSAAQAPALTPQQGAAIVALHGNPSVLAARIDAAKAPATSSAARDKLAATGDPTGALRVPTVTMHGIDDPLALVQNEPLLRQQVDAKDESRRLLQLYIASDDSEPSKGYGHCMFSNDQMVGAIDTLDQWVRQGPRPTLGAASEQVSAGLDPTYAPQKWPSGAH